jgi:para-aminobenzoate synthetase component I
MNSNEQNFINQKMKMLNWANQFNIFCLLDNNNYSFEAPSFECLLAVGCEQSLSFSGENDFENLQTFYDKKPTWLFGHLGYNAAGNAYKAYSNTDVVNGFFFEPSFVIKFTGENIEVLKSTIDTNTLIAEINNAKIDNEVPASPIKVTAVFSKEKYIEKIQAIQNHIKRGDCYELNFCQKFYAHHAIINPLETYKKLIKLSPTPFAALYKLYNKYCICASPERFLQKKGNVLLSQPIKGTSRRDEDEEKDTANKKHLLQSTKEKSENVMVVDLVRNDMSMICEKGSVFVKELFGIYSFPQVHQMISTVQGTLPNDVSFSQAIQACFPMGSMTGAPKQRVMQLIEQYEEGQRGLFSGSIGYINPESDFDFNVVIRSIFYDQSAKALHFFAGSGITFYSNAAEEYDECMAKAEAMISVLAV